MKDCFVPFKLLFFKEIAKKLNEFLVVFQTNKPMALFLTETEDLSKTFMRKFIRKDLCGKSGLYPEIFWGHRFLKWYFSLPIPCLPTGKKIMNF